MGENNNTLMGSCHILVNAGPRVTLQGSSLSNSEMTLVSHHYREQWFLSNCSCNLDNQGMTGLLEAYLI